MPVKKSLHRDHEMTLAGWNLAPPKPPPSPLTYLVSLPCIRSCYLSVSHSFTLTRACVRVRARATSHALSQTNGYHPPLIAWIGTLEIHPVCAMGCKWRVGGCGDFFFYMSLKHLLCV